MFVDLGLKRKFDTLCVLSVFDLGERVAIAANKSLRTGCWGKRPSRLGKTSHVIVVDSKMKRIGVLTIYVCLRSRGSLDPAIFGSFSFGENQRQIARDTNLFPTMGLGFGLG